MVEVRIADYADPRDARALVALLDAYACDAAGGGHPLPAEVKAGLPQALARRQGAFSVIAWTPRGAGGVDGPDGPAGAEQPVGLVNCLEGFSTFSCRTLVNVHDVVVLPAWRGRRITQQMLAAVERVARERGACKLTLEVLAGNAPALRAYTREGFAGYMLDPALGHAQLMQKWLD